MNHHEPHGEWCMNNRAPDCETEQSHITFLGYVGGPRIEDDIEELAPLQDDPGGHNTQKGRRKAKDRFPHPVQRK